MRKSIGALFLGLGVLGLSAFVARADDAPKPTTVTGVLIDNACAGKFMKAADPQTAAAGHPKACAAKDSCAASGYAVISGKQQIKLDDAGNKLAKDYLAKADTTTAVSVTGTQGADGTIAVTAINAAPAPAPK